MSSLKLYSPRTLSLFRPSVVDWQSENDGETDSDGPVLLKFPAVEHRVAGRIGPSDDIDDLAPLERARILHGNRTCPDCGRAAVIPLDAALRMSVKGGHAVPGIGRLLGFRCDCCDHHWKV